MSDERPGGLGRFFPGVAALASYERGWLPHDLMAGVSVAAVAVPIAIAYAQLAGLPPVYGLYASILPLVAYALFGTSRQLIMAPDAATCAIVAAVVAPLAGGDQDRYIALSAALSIITGLICIAAGWLRLGFLANFLARPILTGYLNGIGITIIAGQLGKLFGFPVKTTGIGRMLWEFFSKLGQTHKPTLAVGVGFLVLLFALKRFAPRIPGPLVAVGLGIWATQLFHLKDRGLALLGEIPAGFPPLIRPIIDPADLAALAMGGVGLALISYNAAMATARGFAVKNHYEVDANKEFVGLGMANIGAGLLQGFAISGAGSRTAVSDSVGGKSQVTGLVAAGLTVAVLMFLTVPLASLPMAVLAAVLISAASSLLNLPGLLWLRRVSRQEFRLALITVIGVITAGVLPGVLVAVGVALIQIVMRASSPHDAVLGRLRGTDGYVDIRTNPEAETFPGLILYRFDASLLFFNADQFKARMRRIVSEAAPAPRCVVISAGSIPAMDSTGAAALGDLRAELARKGIVLAVAGAMRGVRSMLERTGIAQAIGAARIFPTLDAAVRDLADTGAVADESGGPPGVVRPRSH